MIDKNLTLYAKKNSINISNSKNCIEELVITVNYLVENVIKQVLEQSDRFDLPKYDSTMIKLNKVEKHLLEMYVFDDEDGQRIEVEDEVNDTFNTSPS
ncbi:unnamed protein product [Didymodactylos carnosus]|uniref:Uncharacterized protein n=1 Tax=Didymodactylos carnosus TaxID=1234261 RepID=A0A815B003_9BILA|nr:unnamed protein product [Didymodactylos carnosus]CAF4045364.1 unnamed protein product [Didymodactylos carnosus]